MNNVIFNALINNLKLKNPNGYSFINNLMQNNGNPQGLLQQVMAKATPEQKQNILNQAKRLSVAQMRYFLKYKI